MNNNNNNCEELRKLFRVVVNEWRSRFEAVEWERRFAHLSEAEQESAADRWFTEAANSLAYPWIVRPRDMPLRLYEVLLALRAANGDLEEAAIRLRVGDARLRSELKALGIPKRLRKGDQRIGEPGRPPLIEVIPRAVGLGMTIKVQKLSASDYDVRVRARGEQLIIDIDRKRTAEQERMQRERAERRRR